MKYVRCQNTTCKQHQSESAVAANVSQQDKSFIENSNKKSKKNRKKKKKQDEQAEAENEGE